VTALKRTNAAPTAQICAPTAQQLRTSIVVLAWPPNQAGRYNVFTLLDALGSMSPLVEVVVVSNGVDQNLTARLRAHPRVDRLLEPRANLGVAGGWNLAALEASGEVLVFANEDALADDTAIGAMTAAFADPAVGVVGIRASFWERRRVRPVRDRQRAAAAKVVAVPYGFLFAVRRDIFRMVGGFDDRLSPAFFEEVDIGFRVAHAGYQCAIVQAGTVFHEAGVSSARRRRARISWVGGSSTLRAVHRRNHRLMLKKWSDQSWRAFPIVHPVMYYSNTGWLRIRALAGRVVRGLGR
jgi:GT2 family glycosyltransferase